MRRARTFFLLLLLSVATSFSYSNTEGSRRYDCGLHRAALCGDSS